MRKSNYSDLKERIELGQVVEYKGRTAASVAELDFIESLPEADDAPTGIMTFEHGAATVIDAVSNQDEVGQRSQPFSPEVVQANKPDAFEPGPTSLNVSDTDAANVQDVIKPKR